MNNEYSQMLSKLIGTLNDIIDEASAQDQTCNGPLDSVNQSF
jgi:hypothetical protein